MDQFITIVRTYWKPIVAVLVALILIVALKGCKKEEKVVTKDDSVVKAVPDGDYIPYSEPANASPITGEACANYDKRALGVMYSGSTDAKRVYHNLDLADYVLEMPHRPMHGEPRILAVFQCNTPDKAGPMRSGRVDHISVSQAMGAIYVPWGKSSIAGALLNRGDIDSIEVGPAIRSADGTQAGFIDSSIRMTSANPAFANLQGVIGVAADRGMSATSRTVGFSHQGELPIDQRPNYSKVTIKFEDPNRIYYEYDKASNSYKRFWQDQPHVDVASGEQYAPKNIIAIKTKKEAWWTEIDYTAQGLEDPWAGVSAEYRGRDDGQYPNMQLGDPWFDTKFEGEARFFFNGQDIDGTWKREDKSEAPFQFFDEEGAEIRFVPGQVWMHVVGHARGFSHTDEEEYLEEQQKAAAAGTAVQ